MEKPIIFSTDMVKAILGGRKTMTRRIMKPKPCFKSEHWFWGKGKLAYALPNQGAFDDRLLGIWEACPYGQVGDRLWVRETFSYWGNVLAPELDKVIYKADSVEITAPRKWQPSIHMPRWASRITLEITEVRVERVQEIKFTDCEEEGIKTGYRLEWDAKNDLLRKFEALWDSFNAKRGYGWEVNPFVWVISFKKEE